MPYDLYKNGRIGEVDSGAGTEVSITVTPDEATPAEARLAQASAGSWYATRRPIRLLANLRGSDRMIAGPRGPVRVLSVWPPSSAFLDQQPQIAAGAPVAAARSVREDCFGAAPRETWGLSETCVLTGDVEVVRDFPWLRAMGYVPVASIDTTGANVMGWAHVSELQATPAPPFARSLAARTGPVPMPVRPPGFIRPSLRHPALDRLRPVIVVPQPTLPVALPADVDASAPSTGLSSETWGWIALGAAGVAAAALGVFGGGKKNNRGRKVRNGSLTWHHDGPQGSWRTSFGAFSAYVFSAQWSTRKQPYVAIFSGDSHNAIRKFVVRGSEARAKREAEKVLRRMK